MRSRRLIAAVLALVAFAAGLAVASGGGSAAPADPLAWTAAREPGMVAAAADGLSQVLYEKSPGGAAASARRVARLRAQIDAAARSGPADAATLAGIVLLESAGRADVIAGPDARYAAGLTQIVAQTGTQLLGMHIDVARSTALTRAIGAARDASRRRALVAERARVDQRFDPAAALAATERYLAIARRSFGRDDLAVESYHMGIGNLQRALALYGAGKVSYGQLYFDSTPTSHPQAYAWLSSLGDDSATYLWRVLAAERIMAGAPRPVLRPLPGTPLFGDRASLAAAVSGGTLAAVPANAELAPQGTLHLRAQALAVLAYIGSHVRAIAHAGAPLTVTAAAIDSADLPAAVRSSAGLVHDDPLAASGYTFDIARRYATPAQAQAFQFMLDRLRALNVISWVREPAVIHVVVGPRAALLKAG